ncbi:Rieske (2Fe-2S) protein [Embleya sp. NBC_00896]|uniref:Rieske (2Fe-2S) protein n=1 Tax=Embleya sp. NBC_00896 TaxID=2975961 RepID=UPI00386CAA61|nr:Rieske (2Fe-2S) protein [Embleya sp. NBC_00896]
MSPFRRDRPPVCLGTLASLPEDVPKRVGTSPPVAVVRHGETVHAFEDRCPHAGAILSRGVLVGEQLTCPAHKGVFEITTGRSIGDIPCRTLRTYTTWIENDHVYRTPTPQPKRTARHTTCPDGPGATQPTHQHPTPNSPTNT